MSLTLFPEKVLPLRLEQATTTKFALGTLTISNNNEDLAVAFKFEKKALNTKCSVSPESGKIAAGGSMLVAIRYQLSKDDKKIRVEDGFIIRSVLIPHNRHNLKLYDIWASPEVNRRRGNISESNFLVVFEEDSDHLGSRPHQPIPSEIVAEIYGRGVVPQRMLVGFHPEHAITFQRPLTRPIPRSLIITNHNLYAIAFSLKTKAPEFYFTRPNFGRVKPGQNIHITIESRPLLVEPPLSQNFQHKFLIDIAAINPEQENLSVNYILKYAKESGGLNFYSHKLHVAYIPAEGLTREDLTEYAAGMVPIIPGELISIYPVGPLYFQRPVNGHSNLKGGLAITNVDPGPIAFRLKMYSVDPVSGTIESGMCLRIKVQRHQMKNGPLRIEKCQDVFCIESTRLSASQENIDPHEIWATVEREKKEIFQRKLPVSSIYFGGLTPEQQAFKEQQIAFQPLVGASGDELVAQEQRVDARETSIHKWLLTVAPG